MIINRIPTRIQIQVEDEESESGLKFIETEVICVAPLLYSEGESSSKEAMMFMSMDDDGKLYGRSADDVKILDTRKYGEKEIGSTQHPFKKKRKYRGKKNSVRNHNTEHKGGNKSDGKSDSGRSWDEKQTNGGN